MRALGNALWLVVPLAFFLLLLPHAVEVNLRAMFLVFLSMLLVNTITFLLPYQESLFARRYSLLSWLFLLTLIALLCTGLHFSGGLRSPLYPLLLLVTAYGCGMSSSSRTAVMLATASTVGLLSTALAGHTTSKDVQLLCAEVFFLLMSCFFFDRLSAEGRAQERERARAMEELRQLSEMNRSASGFVSAVSFEMRTPLTSIQGFSEILASRAVDEEKEKEYVEIIRREAGHLTELVEDLLDISRLESGKLHLDKEPASVGDLIRGCLPVLSPACDLSQVALTLPSDLPEVIVDPKRAARVFTAVFDFVARRFGSGTEVRITAKAEGEEVVVTTNIRNREASLSRVDARRAFLHYWDPGEDDLDMAMAKRIVLAHGGSFKVIRATGGWLTVVIRFPRSWPREIPSLVQKGEWASSLQLGGSR